MKDTMLAPALGESKADDDLMLAEVEIGQRFSEADSDPQLGEAEGDPTYNGEDTVVPLGAGNVDQDPEGDDPKPNANQGSLGNHPPIGADEVDQCPSEAANTALRRHFEMLHGLALASHKAGQLFLIGLDVDAATGKESPALSTLEDFESDLCGGIVDFEAQDAEAAKQLMDAAEELTADAKRHLYAPLAVTHATSEPHEDRLVAVLGLVAYLKGDADCEDRFPLKPQYVLAAGDELQAFYLLDKPAAVAETKPVALALQERAGCDPATADLAHGWWVAGNLRWSSDGAEFQPVQVVKAWDGGSRTALADLKDALGVVDPEPEPAKVQQDDEAEEPHTDFWPMPLGPAAFHGLAGEVVRELSPHSEADEAALLVQFIAAFGNAIGRDPHARVEADRHAGNLFIAIVGATGTSRKGTSWGRNRDLFAPADPPWAAERIMSGLSSGEGLIYQVRDPVEKREPVREKGQEVRYETVIVDHGVEDKRLLVLEPELGGTFGVMARKGNILSPILRQAWDGGTLGNLPKNNSMRATEPHISIIGHITTDELRHSLPPISLSNGLVNRFLFVCARRSKYLPHGGALAEDDRDKLVEKLRHALETARAIGRVQRDEEARALWAEMYPELSEGRPGLFGAATSRADAQVLRLSVIYALLDGSPVVRREHLEAATEVWRYCVDSARYIFGDAPSDPITEKLVPALRAAGADGLSKTQIRRDVLKRHGSTQEIDRALDHLCAIGLVTRFEVKTSGRPASRWKILR